MSNIHSEVLDKIIYLYEGYSKEHRASTQPFHLEKVKKTIKDYKYDCRDLLIREPLIEHSGSLPIVATTIYPHIKDESVDLGKALIMLAIHDIGEIVVGDQMFFATNGSSNESEKKEALKLLPLFYHDLYLDMEERRTNTGKFAKAIDRITPEILDLMAPAKVSIERYRVYFNGKEDPIKTIDSVNGPFMIWNNFMENLHSEIMRRLEEKLKM
jgi:HD domain-containing protein